MSLYADMDIQLPRTVDPTNMPYMGIRDLYIWKQGALAQVRLRQQSL